MSKNVLIGFLVVVIVALGGYVIVTNGSKQTPIMQDQSMNTPQAQPMNTTPQNIPVSPQAGNQPAPSSGAPSISTTISSPYITGSKWPPVISQSSTAYSCTPTTAPGAYPAITQKVINGKTYCISSAVDGGAGHFGGDYIYTTASGSGTKTATFQIQWNNCGGYGGPGDAQYDQCKIDQSNVFNNLDLMVDSLM